MMLEKLFGFNPVTMNVRTEILAGVTVFLAMSYILAVNPEILAATGMDRGALFTATALVSLAGTLMMSLLAKLPFALAPGMGLNAFFAYTICLGMGHRWEFALTAVLLEGLIFIVLTLTNLREALVNALPQSLKSAISVGIGLFVSFIGLRSAGIIVNSEATSVTLGDITSGPALLGLLGILVTSVLLIRRVTGALLLGILATALLGIPMGITHFEGLFSAPPSLAPIFCRFDFSGIFTAEMAVTVFTLLFMDMFDTIGCLVGVTAKAGMMVDGKIPRAKQALLADAFATTLSAVLGTSTTTTYAESATGVAAGGRSGLTSFATALCFLLALFFAPLFLSIPSAATCPAMFLVGMFMIPALRDIPLDDYSEAVPAFVTVLTIPLAYSISDGIAFGMIAYTLMNLFSGRRKKISLSMVLLTLLFVLKYFI